MRATEFTFEAKDHKKDYGTFAQSYTKINKAVDDANLVLKKLTKDARGTMGMIDPKVKSSSEYKIAKANYDKVDALRKRFLKGVPKDFMRKYTFENFADGKTKGKSKPGRVKKSGASCKGSVTHLRKMAKKYSGERGKMYHWCANMKGGRNK